MSRKRTTYDEEYNDRLGLKSHLDSEKSSKYKQGQKGQCLFGSYCILLQTYHESIIWEFIIIRTKY